MLQRWYPIVEARRMEDVMDRLWCGFGPKRLINDGFVNGRTLPLDVEELEDNVIVKASLPGVRPEEIKVTIEDHLLTIQRGLDSEDETKEGNYLIRERRQGSFHRTVRLPKYVDVDKAESMYEHGVLVVTLPKQEEKKARQIEVKVSS